MTDDIDVKRIAVDRIRSLLSPSELDLADRVQALYARYVPLKDRDSRIKLALRALVRSLATTGEDGEFPDKRRILAFCGESGSGKTRALLEHVRGHIAMQPFIDENNMKRNPVLMFRPPSPCTPHQLASTGLRKLGFLVKQGLRENEIWHLFRTQLRVYRISFIVLDEAQDAVEAADRRELIKIANAIKNLVQLEDWPVRVILAGVWPLDEFLKRKQLYNRTTVIPFDSLEGENGLATIDAIIDQVLRRDAELEILGDLPVDMSERLRHACDADLGSILQMVRGAAENAMEEGKLTVGIEHFMSAYRSYAACTETENIFGKDVNWQTLDPLRAKTRVEVDTGDYAKDPTKKKQPSRYGAR